MYIDSVEQSPSRIIAFIIILTYSDYIMRMTKNLFFLLVFFF